jgi:DNA (cytosine-5)-methyltransferase 1
MRKKDLEGYKFIDLFSGLGGFRLALEYYRAECVFSSDIDDKVNAVYYNNFKDKPAGDITKIEAKDIPDHDILCAGFPCQSFSISGKKLGFNDSRGTLFFDVARIVKEKKPKVVILENVKNFTTHDNGNTLRVVEATMHELGYTFFYKVLNAVDFGIPQNRERVYMISFRKDLNINKFNFPISKSENINLKDILLKNSNIGKEIILYEKGNIKEFTGKPKDRKPIRIGIIGKGGQGERIYSTKGSAITISANGGGRFAKTGGYLIGNKIRKLHPRECARLMGFPDSYILAESFNQSYKQLGNSVVIPVLVEIIKEIKQVIK